MIIPHSSGTTRSVGLLSLAVLSFGLNRTFGSEAISPEHLDFFEKKIRPVLVEHCYECHDAGQGKIKGGLALTSKNAIAHGGDSGPMLTTGDPETSLLIKAVRYKDRDFQMPPRSPLPTEAVRDLEKWITMGAPDPRNEEVVAKTSSGGMSPEEGRNFWSFQKRSEISLPSLPSDPPVTNPVDAFIRFAQREKGLTPSLPAEKEAWIRRVTFDLTGLPPTPEEVDVFLKDTSPEAREKTVDRLLDSPHYGVRWGRHWLDVARYADSNGLDENLAFGNAWRYRDYVFKAFNEDKPFDRFLIEQLAGDLLPGRNEETLVATGFLALGARVLAEPDRAKLEMDVIDEQLDTLGKTFLGLTLGCARCHDHKFDPILQSDYYSLAAIFRNTSNFDETKTGAIHHWFEHKLEDHGTAAELKDWDKKIEEARKAASGFKSKTEGEIRGKARAKAVDYLVAAVGFDPDTSLDRVEEIAADFDLHPRILYHTRRHLGVNRDAPVFKAWWEYQAKGDLEGLRAFYEDKFEKAVLLFSDLQKKDPKIAVLPDADLEVYRAELFDNAGFLAVPAKPEHAFDEIALAEYDRLEEEARVLESAAPDHPAAMGVADVPKIVDTLPIHIRGSHLNLGDSVPRAFPAVFSSGEAAFPEKASGRLELAKWMADPDHPLTARVIVNRVWRWHFGQGLVGSMENFGPLGETPSHPELLDWLANWFVDEGWSIKKLNRLILLSETYGMSSTPAGERYAEIDPENRFLSFFPIRRLEAEEVRDAILAVSGRLDGEQGGKTIPLRNRQMVFNHTSKDHTSYDSLRRTAYLPVVRNNLYDWLQLFDFPDPTMPTGHRVSTTIAPQALIMLNAPLAIDSSAAFARRLLSSAGNDDDRIHLAWQLAFGRSPSAAEAESASSFLVSSADLEERWTLFCHSLFASNQFIYLN